MTSRVMRSPTVRSRKPSLCAASRTMSRSERMPTGRPPSTAISDAMLWWPSSASASRIDCSGRTVTAIDPFRARMFAIFIRHLLLWVRLPTWYARLPDSVLRPPARRSLRRLRQKRSRARVRCELAPRHPVHEARAGRPLRAEAPAAKHRFGDQVLRDPQHARGDHPPAAALELAARLEMGHVGVERVGDRLDPLLARRR